MKEDVSILNAIIRNDANLLQKLSHQTGFNEKQRFLNFTLPELSHFFGSRECLAVLNVKQNFSFLVQKKGESSAKLLNLNAFENFFKVIYRPSIQIPSYSFLKFLINQCPYTLRSKWLASENYALKNKYKDELINGHLANMSIRWISDEKGYGAFAESDIKAGDFVGEYAGRVRRLLKFAFFKKEYPKLLASRPNAYCMQYPTRFWSLNYVVIDALHEGNLTRFINHDFKGNLKPLCLIDRGLLRQVFVAAKDIEKGSELLFDYGPDFSSYSKS